MMTRALQTAVLESFANKELEVALYVTDPGDLGVGTEVSGLGYARQVITPSIGALAGGKPYAYNETNISFPVAEAANWGTVAYIGLIDNGDMLWYTSISNPQAVLLGDSLVFLSGSLQITLS